MKEILTVENNAEELGTRCDEINPTFEAKEVREIVHEIKDTMRKKNLKYLSAPAIGYRRRIFCIDWEDSEIKTYINPLITHVKGLTLSKETSIIEPNKTYIRPRNTNLAVMYQTPTGQSLQRELVGMAACIWQQMTDLLDGIFLSDIGLEIDEDYEKASEEDRQAIIEMYLDSLDLKAGELNKIVEEDPELKELDDGIKFMEAVNKGEVQLEDKQQS